MDRLEVDPYSTDDEERRLEHAVGHFIDQALADAHEAGEGQSVAGLDRHPGRGEGPQRYDQDGSRGSRDQGCDEDLFGDEAQVTDHTSDPSHDPLDEGSCEGSSSSSSPYQSSSMLASTNTSCASQSALVLPSGNGRPLIYTTVPKQPQRAEPRSLRPSSHMPRRLSGNDYKRLRLQREAEYQEAQEKLRRGEITPAQMPAPVRQRMSRRRKQLLKEQEELEGAVWKVRPNSEVVSATSSPAAIIRGASLEGARSAEYDEDDEVRALALSARDGTRRTSASAETGQPSTAVSSPLRATSSLPPPLFSSPASRVASPSLPSTPTTLLNLVLKRGPEQDWTAAAAAMQPLPRSPSGTATSAVSTSSDNGPDRSREHSVMSVRADPQRSVSTSRRDLASDRTIIRSPEEASNGQGLGNKEKQREQSGAAASRPLPATKASPALAQSIPKPKPSSSSFSPYTAPLRRELHLVRQRTAIQVKMHQTDLNRLKLEADVLKNASKVVDSRILELERRKRARILAKDEASRSVREASGRERG